MRDLNYQLKQLCRRNRDGSYATQAKRLHHLMLIANQLYALGFRGMKARSLNPKHIHIQSERKLAKFLLQPVQLANSTRFPAHELNRLNRLVEENGERLLEAWHEYFRG